MAARGISLYKVPHFHTTLASTSLEWLLIILLFIHAIFSYSITKFARYCNLQVPCLLCSRLDHVLGSEKLGFYWDLICRHHKLEISSLVVCQVHNKLVDVHGMCENCLFSFATINKSNAETYRLLVGKLGEDSPAGLDEDAFEDHMHSNNSKKICSCCNEPYILRNQPQNFLRSHFDYDDLKKMKEPVQAMNVFNPLPHIEYSKVKNFSDTESEVPFSDDDDGIAIIRESAELKKNFVIQSVLMVPRIVTLPDDLISEKLINTDSMSEISLLDLQEQIGNNDPKGSKHVSSTMAIGHGLEEISWLHVEPNVDASDALVTQIEESKICVDRTETVELEQLCSQKVTHEEIKPVIKLETNSEMSYVKHDNVKEIVQLEQGRSGKVAVEETKPVIEREASPEIPSLVIDKVLETVNVEQISAEKVTSEEIKPVVEYETSPVIPSAVNDKITETVELEQTISQKVTHEEIKPVIEREASLEIPSAVNDKVIGTVEAQERSSEKVAPEVIEPVIERLPSSEMLFVITDSITPLPDNLELGEAYKLAVGNNRRPLSGKLLEQRSLKESSRTSDDLNLLLSQLSAARGMDEFTPRYSGNVDEIGTESSRIIGMPILQKRISLERNRSGFSLDESVIGDIEGESEVDWLKRQVEHDKRLMSALYKELEEERSASAISANQAMAMITRLQEEKASLQMEASQCVRMMEEQAEYDVEALQKANDLLAEKEKEMQDLEDDLDYFRSQLENISMLEREIESSCGLESREFVAEQSDSIHFKNSENVDSNSTVDKPYTFSKNDLTYNSYSEFDDERMSILECLRKLEKKLHLASSDGVNLDVMDTIHSRRREDKEDDLKEPSCKEEMQEISSRQEQNSCGGEYYSWVSSMPDVVAIGDAVSYLIKKLEALEAHSNGIDHSFKPLRRGDEEIVQNSGDNFSRQAFGRE